MLTFNLKKEWFEKIKSGEKTHEYREVKPYWVNRLANACKDELFKIAILDCGNNKTSFLCMHILKIFAFVVVTPIKTIKKKYYLLK